VLGLFYIIGRGKWFLVLGGLLYWIKDY